MNSHEDIKKLSEQRYTQFAANYVESETHAKGYDLDRLVSLARPEAHWNMLDVATGGGHTALKFAPYVKDVVASDLTEKMLQVAEAHIRKQGVENVQFRQADAENLPFENEAFDLVTCRIAPHHFPDVQKFIDECARVLVRGGLFVLQDHVLPEDTASASAVDRFEKVRDPSHNYAFSRHDWLKMFKQAGFIIEHDEEISKRHVFIPWAERQGNDEETMQVLLEMAASAPDGAKDWMAWESWGTEQASFVNHHILIVGKK